MTPVTTIHQKTSSQPGISRVAYHYVCSLVGQVAITPASISVNSAHADNGKPARYSVVNFPALLNRAKYARARILDRWQGYAYAHLKSMGWKEYGASDNTVKRATVFIQYQDSQSNHCYVSLCHQHPGEEILDEQ